MLKQKENLDVIEFKKEVKQLIKEMLSSKEKARNFLISTGIYTKTGRLRKPYR